VPANPQPPVTGREDILAAATELFGGSGYDAVSMSAVARRAGTSKANVFHHFCSKQGLYIEVMREACRMFSGAIEEAGEVSGDFEARVRTLVQRDIELMRANPVRAHLIMREVLESGEHQGRALAEEVFEDQFRALLGLFEEGRDRGAIRGDIAAGLAATMMIACNVFLFQSRNVLRHLPGIDFVDDPERYAAMVSRVLIDGLRRRPPTDSKGNNP